MVKFVKHQIARAQAGSQPAEHATGSVIYAYSEVLKANLPVGPDPDISVVGKIKAATNQLHQALDGYPVAFVPMPVLFDKPSVGSKYLAASANVVNSLLGAGGTICYAETGCTVFREYITSVLPTAHAVPDVWVGLHCDQGEIHCATAAQRELDLSEPWWEQLDDWE